jgi:hypothetical protein
MKTKHRMGRIKNGWNYRGYCVYRKHKGNVGLLWQMPDEFGDEWAYFFRTLAEFRRTVNEWIKTITQEEQP